MSAVIDFPEGLAYNRLYSITKVGQDLGFCKLGFNDGTFFVPSCTHFGASCKFLLALGAGLGGKLLDILLLFTLTKKWGGE